MGQGPRLTVQVFSMPARRAANMPISDALARGVVAAGAARDDSKLCVCTPRRSRRLQKSYHRSAEWRGRADLPAVLFGRWNRPGPDGMVQASGPGRPRRGGAGRGAGRAPLRLEPCAGRGIRISPVGHAGVLAGAGAQDSSTRALAQMPRL